MSRNLLFPLFLVGLFLSCNLAWSQENSGFHIVHKGDKQILVEYTGDDETVVIPEGVTQIGDDAFSGCDSLESVVIPKGVIKIGDNAFSGCTSLTTIVFPKGVKNIGEDAFKDCPDLTIHAPRGAKAEEYAKKNGIAFKVSTKKSASSKSSEEVTSTSTENDKPQTVETNTSVQTDIQKVAVPDDYPTIEEAYANVKDGGIITIKAGKYKLSKTIKVDRTVTFQGSTGRAKDVLIACPTSSTFWIANGSPLFQNLTVISGAKMCSGFHISGGTPKILNCTTISRKWVGMLVMGEKTNPHVESCVIKDCADVGLEVNAFAGGTFNDCEIHGNLSGVQVDFSGNPTVTGGKIHENKKAGVYVCSNGRGTFKDCEIYGNGGGIQVKKFGNPTVTGCKIHDNKQGGALFVYKNGRGEFRDCEFYGNTKGGMGVQTSGNPTVIGCKFYDNKESGVIVYENGLGTFVNCEIYGNGLAGIDVRESGNPTVTGCKIHDGKSVGVWVSDGGKGTFNNNILSENYWQGKLNNWVIWSDAGEVKGSGNTPEIPGQR